MYAVIVSGGKQYRVEEGKVVRLEKLDGESGDSIEFDKILMVTTQDGSQLGAPFISGCTVTGSVVRHGRGEKIRITKMKRRKHHIKRMGHRQWFTEVKITSISA